MQKEIPRSAQPSDEYWRSPLLWIALVLVVASVAMATLWHSEHLSAPESLREVAIVFTTSTATALILIVGIERSHLKRALDKNAEQIAEFEKKYLSDALSKTAESIVTQSSGELKQRFRLLAQCEDNGLEAVLPPRQDRNHGKITYEVIRHELSLRRKIEIIGVSLNEFFDPGGGANPGGRYYGTLSDGLIPSKGQTEGRIEELKALMLQPGGPAMRFRQSRETIPERKTDIGKEIQHAIDGIHHLNATVKAHLHQAGSTRIQHRFYKGTPQMWAVITDEYAFIEQYHSAEINEFLAGLKEDVRSSATPDAPCTGGRVPVFQFRKGSSAYIAAKLHFESLWDVASHEHQSERHVHSSPSSPTATSLTAS